MIKIIMPTTMEMVMVIINMLKTTITRGMIMIEYSHCNGYDENNDSHDSCY